MRLGANAEGGACLGPEAINELVGGRVGLLLVRFSAHGGGNGGVAALDGVGGARNTAEGLVEGVLRSRG